MAWREGLYEPWIYKFKSGAPVELSPLQSSVPKFIENKELSGETMNEPGDPVLTDLRTRIYMSRKGELILRHDFEAGRSSDGETVRKDAGSERTWSHLLLVPSALAVD